MGGYRIFILFCAGVKSKSLLENFSLMQHAYSISPRLSHPPFKHQLSFLFLFFSSSAFDLLSLALSWAPSLQHISPPIVPKTVMRAVQVRVDVLVCVFADVHLHMCCLQRMNPESHGRQTVQERKDAGWETFWRIK